MVTRFYTPKKEEMKEKHQKEVEKAKAFLEKEGYDVVFIGIYWSQNYWLDIYTDEYKSDYDFKAVIVPTLRDLVNNSKPISTTVEYKDWQIDIKDVRVFTETLCKCNPAYIETLYTPYSLFTSDYKKIIDERENLIAEQWIFLLKASYGMIKEKEKAFSHPYPSIKDKIDKFGYDPKQLHHIVRLFLLMKHYIYNDEFDMNTWKEDELLMNIKLWKYPLEVADRMKDLYVKKAKHFIEHYKETPKFEAKDRVVQWSKNLVYNNIMKWMKK